MRGGGSGACGFCEGVFGVENGKWAAGLLRDCSVSCAARSHPGRRTARLSVRDAACGGRTSSASCGPPPPEAAARPAKSRDLLVAFADFRPGAAAAVSRQRDEARGFDGLLRIIQRRLCGSQPLPADICTLPKVRVSTPQSAARESHPFQSPPRAALRSARIASECSIAQPISASRWGRSVRARSVRLYSVRGGISG